MIGEIWIKGSKDENMNDDKEDNENRIRRMEHDLNESNNDKNTYQLGYHAFPHPSP